MKPFSDCEFSAFISYAHADDVAWFNWVTDFRNELERGLAARLRGVRVPRMHMSGENGPVSGVLADELKERIADSYAMIIVVHDNYAQSDWCLKELAYFKSLFGDEGFRERLYIVALSETAINQVTGSAAWRALVPSADQLWIPFFEERDRDHPIEIYLDRGLVAPEFRAPFERLREDLVRKLKRVAPPVSLPPPPPPLPPAPPVAAAAAAGQGGVLFGFAPPALAAATSAAADKLRAAGLAVRFLGPDAVVSDFADFAAADALVLPFDDSAALMPFYPGGHLALQRDSWLKKGKPTNAMYWLDLRPVPAGTPAAQGGAAFVAASGASGLAPDALLAALRPAPQAPLAAQGVHIYIESNRNERTLWEPLGEQIRQKWDELFEHLQPARVPPLYLRARGLPVDQIDLFPVLDDADGVVLLWGKKTADALFAQIHKVEGKLPGRDGAPGIVAYLMPPQQDDEPQPAWGWQVLRFKSADAENFDVVAEERDELKRFLQKVFDRRRRRDALPTG
jgi:hypothetical protein